MKFIHHPSAFSNEKKEAENIISIGIQVFGSFGDFQEAMSKDAFAATQSMNSYLSSLPQA